MASADLSRINTNIAALNTLNSLRDVNRQLALHQSRLASGKRINEAADDPAGLTLATKFDNRATYLQQAMDNIGDAKNLLSVAEGGLSKVNEILGKMRVKAEQAASDSLGDDERKAIAGDLNQLRDEINDIVKATSWNGKKLLDGLSTSDWGTNQTIQFQTGVDTAETTSLTSNDLGGVMISSAASGLDSLASYATSFSSYMTTAASAQQVMTDLDTAVKAVSARLQTIGSMVSRLSFKEENLATAKVNTEAAYNRIMNADMAMEQLSAVKFQILQQTATSMLAQANQAPQAVLQLFR